jgi:hypothetical protein
MARFTAARRAGGIGVSVSADVDGADVHLIYQ